ncbi:MAG: transaldolase, partial [Acidobacteriota bacterium]
LKDITGAADLLRVTWESSRGGDGYVSLEVSPRLARKTQETIDEAARLWRAVDRPNVLIKIPGTEEGLPAIEECLFRGVNVNITLLFSLERHGEVMEAYLRAMERRLESGEPLDTMASVASFFLSRIDVKVDGLLEGGATEDAAAIETLRGNVAVASAREAYRRWKAVFSGSRWDRLREAGARLQKPLWASTSTKNPAYSDVRYVEPLVGRNTITTLPDETLDAFRDHGRVRPDAVEEDPEASRRVLDALEPVGLHLGRITDELVDEGIRKFCDPFDSLMEALDEKRQALA